MPEPATELFTWLGVYCTTSIPNLYASAKTSPLACPTLIAVRTLFWKKTCSTAIAVGFTSSINASRSLCNNAKRRGSESSLGEVNTPIDMASMRPPARGANAANPHRVRPGSIPSTTVDDGANICSSLVGAASRVWPFLLQPPVPQLDGTKALQGHGAHSGLPQNHQ